MEGNNKLLQSISLINVWRLQDHPCPFPSYGIYISITANCIMLLSGCGFSHEYEWLFDGKFHLHDLHVSDVDYLMRLESIRVIVK